jgi:hypothetical protein
MASLIGFDLGFALMAALSGVAEKVRNGNRSRQLPQMGRRDRHDAPIVAIS